MSTPDARGTTDAERKAALWEALAAFGVATVLCSAAYWLGKAIPFVQRNLGGIVALVFIFVPIHLLDKKEKRLADYGFWLPTKRYGGLAPLPRALAWGIGSTLVIFSLFILVYVGYYDAVCAGGPELLGPLGRNCRAWTGYDQLELRLPKGFAQLVLAQLIVVAIPEEIFYRAYLQGRLEDALPSKRCLFGAPIGWPLLIQAALFGLGHFLVDFNPLRLAVAIPALFFGLLRGLGGNIVAPVIAHASANLMILVIDASFFPT